MRERNPIFVAGFPYILFFIGYIGLQLMAGITDASDNKTSSSSVIGLVSAMILVVIATGYVVYWLVDTAKVLRKETQEKIPNPLLIVIPFANYWYMWRYAQAAEKYTKGKVQGVLGFVLLALLGSIGMGIMQDTYNKLKS